MQQTLSAFPAFLRFMRKAVWGSATAGTLALLATASAVRADERPDGRPPDPPAQELGEVVVTAPEARDPLPPPADPTAFATVIDTRSAPTQVETLADALSDAVGVQVRRFGGLGDFATVSVRGFSPRQVQVYLDGVPLSRADNETVDLSDLPLDAVERVEVYRGTTPLRFAQAGPGGVVNVVTRRPGAAPLTAASASYGSFDTRKADLTRSASHGRGATSSSATTSGRRATSRIATTPARPRIPPTIGP